MTGQKEDRRIVARVKAKAALTEGVRRVCSRDIHARWPSRR